MIEEIWDLGKGTEEGIHHEWAFQRKGEYTGEGSRAWGKLAKKGVKQGGVHSSEGRHIGDWEYIREVRTARRGVKRGR